MFEVGTVLRPRSTTGTLMVVIAVDGDAVTYAPKGWESSSALHRTASMAKLSAAVAEQMAPKPTKEAFASVVIPPDAFGALPASDRLTIVPAIVEREYVDLAFVTTTEYDDDPDTSWLEQSDDQMGEGYEEHAQGRIDAYNRGDWHMIGVVVEATLTDDEGRTEEFRQSVWGIESDADQSSINEVAQDLTRELVFDLTKFGLEYEWIAQFSDIIAGDLAAQRGEVLALAAD